MADAQVRGASRAAGMDRADIHAQARLLSERLRAGSITQARVTLMAYMSDPGARLLMGDRAPVPEFAIVRDGGMSNEQREAFRVQWRGWRQVMRHVPHEACLVATAQALLVMIENSGHGGLYELCGSGHVPYDQEWRQVASALRLACRRYLESQDEQTQSLVLAALAKQEQRTGRSATAAQLAFRTGQDSVERTAEVLRHVDSRDAECSTGSACRVSADSDYEP